MTLAERKHAAEVCRAHWPGTVVVGVSSTAVADCVELLEHAATQVTTANNVSTHPTEGNLNICVVASSVLACAPKGGTWHLQTLSVSINLGWFARLPAFLSDCLSDCLSFCPVCLFVYLCW